MLANQQDLLFSCLTPGKKITVITDTSINDPTAEMDGVVDIDIIGRGDTQILSSTKFTPLLKAWNQETWENMS